jgi:sigma-B regulation protein RsbU (phosphoserine phosphatase)
VEAALRQAKSELEAAYAALSAANEQTQEELALARRVQNSLLPEPSYQWPDLQVICHTRPAYQVGGDFYSYNIFPPRLEPDKVEPGEVTYSFAVGDVSGKGVSASLLMAASLSRLDASFTRPMRPVERMIYLDKAILPYTKPHHQNCALCYIEVIPPATLSGEIQEGILRVVNAGGIPPYLKRTDGSVEWGEVGGFALGQGLGAETGYQERSLALAKGDMIILISDGVVEANTSTNTIFGFERLEEALRTGPISDIQGMLQHILDRIAAFVGEAEPHDDLTIVVIQV